MTTEVLEGEIIEAESRQLVVSETVSLPVPVEEALRQWEDYQDLTRRLLDASDYQQIGNKRFKKKSAWRKYARAFNITDRVTHEEIMRSDDGFPIFARVRVEARATNGRTAEADQECHIRERCCEIGCRKVTWKGHDCCPSDCNGKRHWSHPGDLPATALTRAKNRAIADLIGAGEVSAEEVEGGRDDGRYTSDPKSRGDDYGSEKPVTRTKLPPPPSCPDHGPNRMKFISGGKNAKGEYGAFWVCEAKDCTLGRNKKGWSIFHDAHLAMLAIENNTNPPMTADEFGADMPNE